MANLRKKVESFKLSGRPNIAVFRPAAKKADAVYQALGEQLSAKGHVEDVDAAFVQSYDAMRTGVIDVLVIPELDLLDAIDFLHVIEYVNAGGALIAGGDDLLMSGQSLAGTFLGWYAQQDDSELGFFRRTIAALGVKPYVSDVAPSHAVINTGFVSGLLEIVDVAMPPAGARFNTTSNVRRSSPSWGAQFAERYEVLRNYPVVTGTDPLGRPLNSAVVFAQNWENGGRYCMFASNRDGSALDPSSPLFAPLVDAAFDFTQNRLVASYCQSSYACYRDGESARITYKVRNFGDKSAEFAVEIAIEGGTDSFVKTVEHRAMPGERITGEALWPPAEFATDFYRVTMQVVVDGRVVSAAENGFVVWKDEVATSGLTLELDGAYFKVDGRKSVILGTNYYESNQNSGMWVKPNVAKLHDDLEQMSKFGMTYVRVHYHHPKWFYDHMLGEQGCVPEEYEGLGDSYLPTEEQLRTFDAHVYLCQKFRMFYGGDLFTMRPVEMGDARGWIQIQDYMWFEEKLAAQKEFLDLLIPRYLDVPGITWDIFNEPMGPPSDMPAFYEQFNTWAGMIRSHMRALGDTHTIVVGDVLGTGGHDPVSDYLAPHGDFRKAATLNVRSTKPQFYQEAWMDRPPTPQGNRLQLEDMKQALTDTLRTGLAGFAPWQWTEQLAMWQAGGTHPIENWDDFLGCCVRHDATLKPSGRFYRDFIKLVANLDVEGFDGDEVFAALEQLPEQSTVLTLPPSVTHVPSGSVRTAQGRLTFNSAPDVARGGHYVLLTDDATVRRGAVRGEFSTEGFAISADSECDVWFIRDPADDIDLVKADGPGRLTITSPRAPRKVTLVDSVSSETERVLAFDVVDGAVSIVIEPWQTYYWLKLQY